MKLLRMLFGLFSLAAIAGSAQAALFDRGNGLVFDDDLDMTWSNTFGGAMSWSAAQEWIVALNTSNAGTGYLGYKDWRLPTSDTCLGQSCTGSEMGHLFFSELGGAPNTAISQHHNANYTLFPSLLDQQYWSGTAYAPDSNQAYIFYFNNSLTNSLPKSSLGVHAWAVRDGDVAAPIPEPETYAMILAGLGLLGFITRRRNHQATA